MKKWDDTEPALLQHWMCDYVNVRCPKGESYQDLSSRVNSFLGELLKRDLKRTVIITHAGVMKAMTATLCRISLEEAMSYGWGYGDIQRMNL